MCELSELEKPYYPRVVSHFVNSITTATTRRHPLARLGKLWRRRWPRPKHKSKRSPQFNNSTSRAIADRVPARFDMRRPVKITFGEMRSGLPSIAP